MYARALADTHTQAHRHARKVSLGHSPWKPYSSQALARDVVNMYSIAYRDNKQCIFVFIIQDCITHCSFPMWGELFTFSLNYGGQPALTTSKAPFPFLADLSSTAASLLAPASGSQVQVKARRVLFWISVTTKRRN